MVKLLKIALLFALSVTLQVFASAKHSQPGWHESQSSYHQALEAVRQGQAMPLHKARALLPNVLPGQVVNTEYEYEFHRWVYEFKVIDTHGRLRAVHLDAKTGELVKITDY